MPYYMTQKMSSGTLPARTYYRKQRNAHPSHEQSSAFTQDATDAYATLNNIAASAVVAGSYRSNQGVPTGSDTVEI
jgi:hypothetical protein